ncbi:glycine-rich cell wall structural protein 2 isoform X2 [Phalaenopsis equestris]|uniref:glycine-rich cell wall structural protein 2 isoform X2 n=1 Tax=Phalaenopsis equestris TaxID=78828 RepID=UPI0009E65A11|nr:glycine-rich cell wall structural protein 2 isoform X2 [Phalaenopsis equestris]
MLREEVGGRVGHSRTSAGRRMSWNNGGNKGLLWRLPVVKSNNIGKLGPGFGFGAGCGIGAGVGLFGGAGLGAGFPGLQFGVGIGAGCGIGFGFGYGMGKGIAYDENRRYSNVGKLFLGNGNHPSQDRIETILDEMFVNTKRLIEAASKEIEKWK